VLIDAEKANYPVAWMCRILRVPRSSFYDWRVRSMQVSATAARRVALGVAVKGVFDESVRCTAAGGSPASSTTVAPCARSGSSRI